MDEEVYWNDARDKCWDMGGELLAVRDVATMNFIKATLNSKKLGWRNQGVWLGARYYSGKWRWTTGKYFPILFLSLFLSFTVFWLLLLLFVVKKLYI